MKLCGKKSLFDKKELKINEFNQENHFGQKEFGQKKWKNCAKMD